MVVLQESIVSQPAVMTLHIEGLQSDCASCINLLIANPAPLLHDKKREAASPIEPDPEVPTASSKKL